jgi:hypothetical protein
LNREKDKRIHLYAENIDSGNIAEDVICDLGISYEIRSLIKEVGIKLQNRLERFQESRA